MARSSGPGRNHRACLGGEGSVDEGYSRGGRTLPVKGTRWCSQRLEMSMSRTRTISSWSSANTASLITSRITFQSFGGCSDRRKGGGMMNLPDVPHSLSSSTSRPGRIVPVYEGGPLDRDLRRCTRGPCGRLRRAWFDAQLSRREKHLDEKGWTLLLV